MVEAMKLAQRMKMNDGTIAPSSIPPGSSAKLPPNPKKRKSAAIEQPSEFTGYGVNADHISDEEEQDENIDVASSGKNSLKKRAPRRNVTTGDGPPVKKLKASPVPVAEPAGLLNFFYKMKAASSSKPRTQTETRADSTTATTTEDMDCKPSQQNRVPDRAQAMDEKSPDTFPSKLKKTNIGIDKDDGSDFKKVQTTAPSQRSKKTIADRRVAIEKTFRVAYEEKDPATPVTTPTSKRSTAKASNPDLVDPVAEKASTPVRSVRDFFPSKSNIKQDDSPFDTNVTKPPSKADNEESDSKNPSPINPSVCDGIDSPTNTASSDPTTHILLKTDRNDKSATNPDTKVAPQPRRRRLVRASDMKVRLHSPDELNDENDIMEPKNKKPTKVVDVKVAPISDTEKEPSPEPESVDQIAQRQMMTSYFSMKSSPSSTATKPTSPVAIRGERIGPPVKPKPSVQRKSKKKKSNFSDTEESGSDNSSKDSDFEDSDGGAKVDEKPDPNQKAITSMFAKTTVSSASNFPWERVRKPKMTERSCSLLSGGLSNYSNTCYLNSVLQMIRNIRECTEMLFSIQERMQAVEERAGSQITTSEYQRSLFEHMLQVLRNLDKKESGDEEELLNRTSHPKDVITTLRQGDSLFNTSEQQDAAEFLFYTISLFDDVLQALLALQKETPDTAPGGSDTATKEASEWHPINDLFQVGTQTVTHCQQCPSVTTHSDRGIDLTVQIDNDNPTMIRDLDWGISETMKMEHMKDDNQRFCDRCSQKADAHIHHYFTSLPKLMILRLQRYNFKEGAVKLQNGVSCTEQMSFSKWMDRDYQGPDPCYELCAILIHRGPVITSGHYYVYIRKTVEIENVTTDANGETVSETRTYRWLKYNDSVVVPVTDEGMNRIFSGRVSGQGSLDSVDGVSSSSLSNHRLDLYDDEVATPYVYIYRRIAD